MAVSQIIPKIILKHSFITLVGPASQEFGWGMAGMGGLCSTIPGAPSDAGPVGALQASLSVSMWPIHMISPAHELEGSQMAYMQPRAPKGHAEAREGRGEKYRGEEATYHLLWPDLQSQTASLPPHSLGQGSYQSPSRFMEGVNLTLQEEQDWDAF